MSIGASIGKRMEHLIRRKGISESELAKALHTNRSTISRIVNDETEKVSSKVLIDAAQYFGVSTDFLHELFRGELWLDRGCGKGHSV